MCIFSGFINDKVTVLRWPSTYCNPAPFPGLGIAMNRIYDKINSIGIFNKLVVSSSQTSIYLSEKVPTLLNFFNCCKMHVQMDGSLDKNCTLSHLYFFPLSLYYSHDAQARYISGHAFIFVLFCFFLCGGGGVWQFQGML